jgi:amidase
MIRQKEVTSEVVVQAHLAHIKQHNHKIQAVSVLVEEEALIGARQADQALSAGSREIGSLHGVPITLKDHPIVKGMRTTLGLPQYWNYRPSKDCELVVRLKRAGAIILGRTNVPFGCYDWNCRNPIYPETVNPWNPTRTPGGSSGGAAAAIATGMVPMDMGSDLAGSVRLPSHCCGIFGLRTTDGLLPMNDVGPEDFPPSPSLLTVCGPMARSIADLNLMLSVLAPFQKQDTLPLPEKLRIAHTHTVLDITANEVTQAAIESFLSKLIKDGHTVTSDCAPEVDMSECFELWATITGHLASISLPKLMRTEPLNSILLFYVLQMRMGGGSLAQNLRRGFHSSEQNFQRALKRLAEIRDRVTKFYDRFDLWILPNMPGPAFERTRMNWNFKVDGKRVDYGTYNGTYHCTTALMGTPGLTVPIGFTEGLPLSLQVHSRAFSDFWLLQVAEHHLEAHTDIRWPNGFGPQN